MDLQSLLKNLGLGNNMNFGNLTYGNQPTYYPNGTDAWPTINPAYFQGPTGIEGNMGLLSTQIQDILKQLSQPAAAPTPVPVAPTPAAPKPAMNIPSAQTPSVMQSMGLLKNLQPGQDWRQTVANSLGLLNMKKLP